MAGRHRARVDRVMAHIRANLSGDLSLDALAEVAAMSRFHWHRVFRGLTGETVAEAVRRARLNRAAVLLAATDTPLPRVAQACGYPDPDSFARAVRAGFGQSPATIRRIRRVPKALLPPIQGVLAMYPIAIRTEAPAEVAALPHHGAYHEIGRTFEALGQRLASGEVEPAGPTVAVYYDDAAATPVGELRAHAGIVVAPGSKVPEGLDRLRIAGGPTAVLTYKGPYDNLQEPWDHLFRWLGQSEHEFGDEAPYERYLNDPSNTPPSELVTEICVPLRG